MRLSLDSYAESIEVSGRQDLSDITILLAPGATPKRPSHEQPLLTGLSDCKKLKQIFIRLPSWVDFSSLEACVNLLGIDLADCNSKQTLALPNSLQILRLARSTFPRLTDAPPSLNYLVIEDSVVDDPVFLQGNIIEIRINSSQLVFARLPKIIEHLKLYDVSFGELGLLNNIMEVGDCYISQSRISQSFSLKNCKMLRLSSCRISADVVISGRYDFFYLCASSNQDRLDIFDDGFYATEMSFEGEAVMNCETLQMISMRCRKLNFGMLDTQRKRFPDLSNSKLESLSIGSVSGVRKLARSLLPDSLRSLTFRGKEVFADSSSKDIFLR